MSTTLEKFNVTQYSVSTLLSYIEAGDIAIPEIQRPFVWKAAQVRDLVDSLYNGYPTGYLIIWQNPNVRLKNGQESTGKKVLIDGQQRVTALMTAIGGYQILDDDYREKTIRIAFNPLAEEDEERFAVQSPIHEKSSFWIPDISKIFAPDFDSYSFIHHYSANNPGVSSKKINQAITQLLSIRGCQLGAIMLIPQLDISEVTEIFVRINSQGKRLNEADFAMSKIAADEKYGGALLRKAIDYFCHLSVDPKFYSQISANDKEFMASIYAQKMNWLKDDNEVIYDPDYSDMLRVSFMHMFGRGKLGDLVSLLSGRDFKERTFKEEIAQDSFAKLSEGVINFMNQYSFEQFILAIKSAGFRFPKLLSSIVTLDFAYTLFLMLHKSNEVPKVQIKRYIQKWMVLSILTRRYSSSPESQMDRDLNSIAAKGFISFFAENEESMLSDTFWNIRLVQNMETSSVGSPYFNTYIAAQIFFKDKSLLSNSTQVLDLIEAGDVHHVFPREYLKINGYTEKSEYNQIANYTYLDTGVNIAIGKRAPDEYFSVALKQCETGEMKVGTILDEKLYYQNLEENCIPVGIDRMTHADYPRFLIERRKRMAKKIRDYYYAL